MTSKFKIDVTYTPSDSCQSDSSHIYILWFSGCFVFMMSEDIQKKLLEYRAKRKREEYINNIKKKTKNLLSTLIPQRTTDVTKVN